MSKHLNKNLCPRQGRRSFTLLIYRTSSLRWNRYWKLGRYATDYFIGLPEQSAFSNQHLGFESNFLFLQRVLRYVCSSNGSNKSNLSTQSLLNSSSMTISSWSFCFFNFFLNSA